MALNSRHIIDFSSLHRFGMDEVGKNAYQLGELKYLEIPIPDGFVVMPSLFSKFLEKTGISKEIERVQSINHPAIKDSMPKLFDLIQKKVINTHIPRDLATELHNSYKKLAGLFREQSLSIFTSPLKGKSLQFLNIKGDANMVLAIKKIWALQIENPTSIIVQKNIKSKIKGKLTTNSPSIEEKFAALAKKIQKHFYYPKDLEYAIEKNKIYVTSLKPLTTAMPRPVKPIAQIKKFHKILFKGIALNPGIVTGSVRILRNQDYYQVKRDEIAVIPQLSKILLSKISKAKAIIADAGLSTDHDKMLYKRNIKIPTIIGVGNAINILQNKSIITVNAITGEIYSG